MPETKQAERPENYNWEDHYTSGTTPPWDAGVAAPELVDFYNSLKDKPRMVFEIGCGTGTNAVWLAQQGAHACLHARPFLPCLPCEQAMWIPHVEPPSSTKKHLKKCGARPDAATGGILDWLRRRQLILEPCHVPASSSVAVSTRQTACTACAAATYDHRPSASAPPSRRLGKASRPGALASPSNPTSDRRLPLIRDFR